MRRAYYGETDGQRRFTPHLTLVQQFPRARLEEALAVVNQARPVYEWEVTEATLVGRRDGRIWESLATYPLASGGTGEPPSSPRPAPLAV
jgi:2'-5' RNA ligase